MITKQYTKPQKTNKRYKQKGTMLIGETLTSLLRINWFGLLPYLRSSTIKLIKISRSARNQICLLKKGVE